MAGIAVSGFNTINELAAAAPSQNNTDSLVFLFQGDSITDGNRGRNTDPNHIMGHGYAFSIASRMGEHFAEKQLVFYNRGISGNRITDLTQRWQKDTIAIKPDILSVLIGINDIDAAIRNNMVAGIDSFEEDYRKLLTQTKEQLPQCTLVLCEPFILPVGRVKENLESYSNAIKKIQESVLRLSTEFKTIFVPLQQVFENAVKRAPANYWIWDGIHPTCAGHELITKTWLKQVSSKFRGLKNIPV